MSVPGERTKYRNMIIRRAEYKDIESLTKLLEQVLMVHYKLRPDILQAGSRKYSDEELAAIIANDMTPIFVAEDENKNVVGHCFTRLVDHDALRDKPHRTLFIDDLCIDENARHMHVGTKLYEYAKDFAVKNKCYNIHLHVWEGNDPARAFYEAVGMKPYVTGMEEILG